MFFFKKNKILTHDGKFHADDVFAVGTLDILYNGRIKVTRSRDPKIIENFLDEKNIIVDNGRDYNPDKNIFDHHQEGGAGCRESGVPYAGFGLIWKHFGLEVCLREIKKYTIENKINLEEVSNYVWQQLDKSIVSNIDATDTGYTDYYSEKTGDSALAPDKIIGSFVPDWQEDYKNADKIFRKLSKLAKIFIQREIKITYDRFLAKNIVEQTYQNSKDKRIIILDSGYPWKDILIEKPEPLFVVFPTINNDGFMVQAVSVKKNSQEIRKKFPENWRGKAGIDLEKVTNIKGAKFCHNAGFLAVANELESAIQLAQIAIR